MRWARAIAGSLLASCHVDTNMSVVGTLSKGRKSALDDWQIAGASVPGAEHRRSDRPNQDALTWRRSDDAVVAVVTDGCGSGTHSELGARLGAHLWATCTLDRLGRGQHPDDPQLWNDVSGDVLTGLGPLVATLGQDRGEAIGAHLLFTVVGAVITKHRVAVVAIGDGLVVVNDTVHGLGPFPDNRPPYLGYGLLPGRSCPEPQLVHLGAVSEVDRLLLGTDGVLDLHERASLPVPGTPEPVGELTQFFGPRCFRHADAMRRRLARIQREHVEVCWEQEQVVRRRGVLPDDTTLIALRRNGGEQR